MIYTANRLIKHASTSEFASQLVLTLVPLWFSAVLALHGNTFGTSLSFSYMASIMSEPAWSLLSGGVGLIAAVCWARKTVLTLIFATMLLAFWHGMVALCVFLANPIGTGTGTYALLALAATLRMIGLAHAYQDHD